MSVLSSLNEALEEKIKEEGRHYSLHRDRTAFEKVYSDIWNALESWPTTVQDLYNIRHWQINRLLQSDGSLRKPKIFLDVSMTSKDNLVLEWYPWPVRVINIDNTINLDHTDWLYWSDYRQPGSGMTDNRIIMIHDFAHFQYRKDLQRSEIHLLEATEKLLKLIYDFLSATFDIALDNDLFLEYDEAENWLKRKLLRVSVRSVKEVQGEQDKKRREGWLKQTVEKIKISPEELLALFMDNEMKASKVATILRTKHSVKIGETALKTILNTLYKDFPTLYDKVLTDAPSGVTPSSRKVIDLFPKRDSDE